MYVLISIIIGIGFSVFLYNDHAKYKKIEEEKKNERLRDENEIEEKQKKYMEQNNISKDVELLFCTNIKANGISTEGKWKIFFWKENNVVNFCGASESENIKKIEIPIENVKYFNRIGDLKDETITEGGGVSWGKAIIGGIVGVVVGWIVGSAMDTYSDVSNFRIFTHSSVYSTVLTVIGLLVGLLLAGRNKTITKNKEIDNRKTYFYYSENKDDKNMVFTGKSYDIFLKLIPEKEVSYIENNKILESDKTQNDSVYSDLEKLSELKEKGILTEEEFNVKKQLLLDKIQ